jgi:hypothetical protein
MLDVLEQPSQLTVIANKIDSGLEAFEQRKSELIELNQEADGLKISSIDDKQTINQVSTIRKKLKSARVEIAKEGKLMRDPLTTISRIISDKEKELIAIIEPTEKSLQEQEKWVEDEKEKIRLAEIAKEEARIQQRINALAQFGFEIDYSDIKSMSDETFEKYVDAAKIQHEKEVAEKAEGERLRLEKEAEEEREREAERLRIAAERKELEELRKKQAEAQRIIDEQNQKIATENKKIADEKAAIERAKQKEIEDKKRAEELKEAQEKAADEARLKAIQDIKDKEAKKLEDERKVKLASERKAARQPDKTKIEAYIASVKSIPVPELKTDEGKSVMTSIQELISRFNNYATEKVSEL